MGFMGDSNESLTTEDPCVRASLKRAVVELTTPATGFYRSRRYWLEDTQLRRLCAADRTALPSGRGSGESRRSSETETETALVGRHDDRGR
ncbi:unnamed protein product [Ectocarpus sp. 12 AP-2014]